jgi:hypothetical protein
MRRVRNLRAIIAIPAAMLILPAGFASADDASDASERRVKRGAEILAHIERPRPEENRFRSQVQFAKGHGLEYLHSFDMGERKMEFGVRGPIMKKEEGKALGVAFEIRF